MVQLETPGIVRVIAYFVLPFAFGGVASAQTECAFENFRIDQPPQSTTNSFGISTDIDGDTLVIGESGAVCARGTVYVHVKAPSGPDWPLEATLVPQVAPPIPGLRFGESLDLDGDQMIVGAPEPSFVEGRAFIEVRSNGMWTQEAVLVPSDGNANDRFGGSVALDGDVAAVGAYQHRPTGGSRYGAVYVFRRTGTIWAEQTKLFTVSPACAHFGTDVALSLPYLAIGSPGGNKVTIYEDIGGSWQLTDNIVFPNTSEFGQSLDITQTTLVVGGPRATTPGGMTLAGMLGVYTNTGTAWVEQQFVFADDAQFQDLMGEHVAISGDRIVAGAMREDTMGNRSGAAYVFSRSGQTWTQEKKLLASNGGPSDNFGKVSMDDTRILSGANGMGGAAYIYHPDSYFGPPLTYCTGKTNSLGCVPFLTTEGTPSATSTAPFRIIANDMVPEVGNLFYAHKKANLNFHGGKLCVKAPFTRLPHKTPKSTGNLPCISSLRRNFNARIQGGLDPMLTVGQTVFAQWRSRDNGDPAGFSDSITDGVRFSICP